MNRLAPLKPSHTFDQLFPPQTAYAPRTTLDHVGWVVTEPYRLDTLTAVTVLANGAMPMACHQNAVTPDIVRFFERCGCTLASQIETYETPQQAFAVAKRWADEGWRLVYPYPLPDALCDPASLLVPTALYNWLNDKSNLDQLVDAELLPPAVMLKPEAASDLLTVFAGQPVFIKACVAGASGSGVDVRHAPDDPARQRAAQWLAARTGDFSGVRVEQALEVAISWCLNLTILDDRVEYLGAAIQLFASPGQQKGSLIDPRHVPPASAVDSVLRIAHLAQRMG